MPISKTRDELSKACHCEVKLLQSADVTLGLMRFLSSGNELGVFNSRLDSCRLFMASFRATCGRGDL